MPHRNRQRKPMQIQKAIFPICSLVAATNQKPPHKEKKRPLNQLSTGIRQHFFPQIIVLQKWLFKNNKKIKN
jgi:hypothetical protein